MRNEDLSILFSDEFFFCGEVNVEKLRLIEIKVVALVLPEVFIIICLERICVISVTKMVIEIFQICICRINCHIILVVVGCYLNFRHSIIFKDKFSSLLVPWLHPAIIFTALNDHHTIGEV